MIVRWQCAKCDSRYERLVTPYVNDERQIGIHQQCVICGNQMILRVAFGALPADEDYSRKDFTNAPEAQ